MKRHVWFGTRERSTWIPAPAINPDATSQAWSTDSSFLNGGAAVRHSWGSHKRYNLSWNLQPQEKIMPVLDCASGMFGTGLVYYADPFSFYTNVVPKDWATPYLATLDGVIINGVNRPVQVTSNAPAETGLPYLAASYTGVTDAAAKKVWIPVPPGYQAQVKAYGSGTATYKLDVSGSVKTVPWSLANSTNVPLVIFENEIDGGFDLWLGGTGSCVAIAIQIKLMKVGDEGYSYPGTNIRNLLSNPSSEATDLFFLRNTGSDAARLPDSTPLPLNLVPNPSAEVDLFGWAGSQGTVFHGVGGSPAYAGSGDVRLTMSGTVGASPFLYTSTEVGVISPGYEYTASAYARRGSTFSDSPVGIRINWVNSTGATISSTSGDSFTMTGSDWTRAHVTATAPAEAARIVMLVLYRGTAQAGNIMRVDGAMINSGGLVDYIDGDSPGMGWSGQPHRSTSGWVGGAPVGGAGSHFLRVTGGSTTNTWISQYAPVGDVPTLVSGSAWVRASRSGYMVARIYTYNAANQVEIHVGPVTSTPAGQWIKLGIDGITPAADTSRLRFFAFICDANGLPLAIPSSEGFDVDCLIMSNGPSAPFYFDGDSPGFSWEGVAHGSPSVGALYTGPKDWTFMGGQGTSGMRFVGRPQLSQYSAAMDKVGVSATLAEVGAWQ